MKRIFLSIMGLIVLNACGSDGEGAFYDGGTYLSDCFASGQDNSVRGRVVFADRAMNITSLRYEGLGCSGTVLNETPQGSLGFDVRTRDNLTYLVSQDPEDTNAEQFIFFVELPEIIYTWTVNALPAEGDPNLQAFLQDPRTFISVEVDDGGSLIRD